MRKIILGLIWICTAWLAFADVKVSGIFSDNMVLQRGKPIPVCGFADADEDVIVEYNGVKATAKTGSNGRFKAGCGAVCLSRQSDGRLQPLQPGRPASFAVSF